MNIAEAIAACEAHNPKLSLIATQQFQLCHHSDGATSRCPMFRVSVIPDGEEVRQYHSSCGFEQCVADLIASESKAA